MAYLFIAVPNFDLNNPYFSRVRSLTSTGPYTRFSYNPPPFFRQL